MLCAFPLVGAFIGLFLWLWTLLSRTLGFSAILYAAGITLIPVLITGGIHLDASAIPRTPWQVTRNPPAGVRF